MLGGMLVRLLNEASTSSPRVPRSRPISFGREVKRLRLMRKPLNGLEQSEAGKAPVKSLSANPLRAGGRQE